MFRRRTQEHAADLLDDGHEVVVHARNTDRLTAVRDLVARGATAVVGDLSDPEQTRTLADEVNRDGRLGAMIHNAGVYTGAQVLRLCSPSPASSREWDARASRRIMG